MSIGADIVIYHNPDCGTSRNTLALIRASGIEPHVVEYLKTPPARPLLADLIRRTGLSVRAVLREKGTPFDALGLGDPTLSDDQLLDAMMAHPILINRPLVVSPSGVALCRPSDVVLDILPQRPSGSLDKEEGAPFLADRRVAPDDPALLAALRAADLPTDDLGDGGRSFFAFETLDGTGVGHGGFEVHGDHALIRSIAVAPDRRSGGIGRNIVPLLLYRARAAGAAEAWLLTTSAAPFFARAGFKPVDRDAAPDAIRTTRQAASLCPASATLMRRRITF